MNVLGGRVGRPFYETVTTSLRVNHSALRLITFASVQNSAMSVSRRPMSLGVTWPAGNPGGWWQTSPSPSHVD
jgi:hypothetical protein